MNGVDPRVVMTSLAWGAAVATALAVVWPAPRRLSVRLRPYTQVPRARLGTGLAETALLEAVREERSAVGEVFGPVVRRGAELVSSLVDVGGRDTVALRLRQAGMADMTVEQYRLRQLAHTVAFASCGVALGVLLGRSPVVTLVLGGLMVFPGATRLRSSLVRVIEDNRRQMRTELYTVCQQLALHARVSDGGPVEAVRQTVRRSNGPVSGELREALAHIKRGQSPVEAYTHLARVTPEPGAARLYRALAVSFRGGDPAPAFLALANTIRAERREDLARLAAKRRTLMVLPLVVVMGPIMLLFVGAAIPSLMFRFQ